MKNKGYILLETIIGMMIFIVIFTVIVNMYRDSYLYKTKRIQDEKMVRIAYCVMQELKYNYTLEQLDLYLGSTGVNFELNEDTLMNLLNGELFSLPVGEGIAIVAQPIDDKNVVVKLELKEMVKNIEYSNSLEFVKHRWMEKVHEE